MQLVIEVSPTMQGDEAMIEVVEPMKQHAYHLPSSTAG